MRIGIVTGEYPPMEGGIGAYSRMLASEMERQGQEVVVCTKSMRAADGVRVATIVRHWGPGALNAVRHYAERERLDIINIQFQTAAYAMSPWIHFLPDVVRHIPVVTTFHDLRFPYLFPKAGALRTWIVRHMARASDGVIVTNHEDARQLAGLPHSTLIPIGSNITAPLPPAFDAAEWRARAGALPGDLLIAYFGFANRSKGINVLLDALAKLRDQGVPARLTLIGGRTGASDPTNAVHADEVDEQIEALQIKPFVSRTGFIEDNAVAAYLRAADVVALPFLDGASYRRGTLMAAIHHGCAIVTTEPSVEIATFVNGENMLLVPPGDSIALAYALRRVYQSPALRERLRQGAAALAPQFSWTRIACDTLEFFQQLRQ